MNPMVPMNEELNSPLLSAEIQETEKRIPLIMKENGGFSVSFSWYISV